MQAIICLLFEGSVYRINHTKISSINLPSILLILRHLALILRAVSEVVAVNLLIN